MESEAMIAWCTLVVILGSWAGFLSAPSFGPAFRWCNDLLLAGSLAVSGVITVAAAAIQSPCALASGASAAALLLAILFVIRREVHPRVAPRSST